LKTGYLSVCYTTADCQTDSHTLLIFLLYHGVNIQGISYLQLDLKTQYVMVYIKKKRVELNRLSTLFNKLT
jgi:hypothetical protein